MVRALLRLLPVVVLLTAFPPLGSASHARVYLRDFNERAAEFKMLEAINTIRYRAGLPLLDFDYGLCVVARHHALDMAVRDYFDHFTPEGLSPLDRVRRAGLPYEVTENIGIIRTFGQDMDEVVEALMSSFLSSPEHMANILDPNATHVGIGFYQDLSGSNHRLGSEREEGVRYDGFGTVLVVQDFCRRSVRIISPSPFPGETECGRFLELELSFADAVDEAFLRITPADSSQPAYEVPLFERGGFFRARFAFSEAGRYSIGIYASFPSEEWYYREHGSLELTVYPGPPIENHQGVW